MIPPRRLFSTGLLAVVLLAAGWAGVERAAAAPAGTVVSPMPVEQKRKIGRRIWQNECGGTVEGLTGWNAGEDFPSLGIGHTLWFPAGVDKRFTETFPDMVVFMQANRVRVPAWVVPSRPCPWPDRAAFQRDFRSPKMKELRAWLAATIDVQTEYLISRQRAALPKILAACPAGERAVVRQRFDALAATPEGMFCLIDYVNFKGEGTNPSERYNGQGWGLLQVLQEIRGTPAGGQAVAEFAAAAARVLARRVRNAPAERGEARWQAGWLNRCARYNTKL